MTAIAAIFVQEGFVIAADGRSKSDTAEAGPFDTDEQQKVFPIENEDRTLAYSILGFGGTNDGRFKIVDEIEQVAKALAGEHFVHYPTYVSKLCRSLQQAVVDARRDGRITQFPENLHRPPGKRNGIFRLLLLGYFKTKPVAVEINFLRDSKDQVRFDLEYSELSTKAHLAFMAGSDFVGAALGSCDPAFAKYWSIPLDGLPRDRMAKLARNYIEACCDPLARQRDPICQYIGGHIHIAEITSAGFRWLIAPINH